MMSLTELIQHHLEYDAWANNRLLDIAEELTLEQLNRDFGTADKSIKGTLMHVFRSARTWQLRIEKATQVIPWVMPEDEDWPALRPKWAFVQQRWTEWAKGLREADLHEVLVYSDLKGNPRKEPLWQVLLHVVNHGTHHRGQISGFLRASGLTPPSLDFIAFVRQRAG